MSSRARLLWLVVVCGLLEVSAAGGQGQSGAPGRLPRATSRDVVTAIDATVLEISPRSGPASPGATLTIYGLGFQPGATVMIGGFPTTGIAVAGDTQITATLPTLQPGAVHDVVVTNPVSPSGTLTDAFFTNFLDVPPPHPFRRFVEKVRRLEITAGCGAGNYCPDAPVTRAQMAVFLLKAAHGPAYTPPPAAGNVFTDVPATAFAADWIEQLASEGITAGCGGGNYCPSAPITRAQMAVFLLTARYGSGFLPPPATGLFSDVPASNPFARWIESLSQKGITAGCGGGSFCPGSASTRGQMAVFLVRTFAGSSQELIAEAFEDGLIDYPTSLLYRAYALFWDARLPAEYDGAGSGGEDSGFFQEVRLVWPELSVAEQASLTPFIVRPDDPLSVFGPSGGSGRRPAAAGTECPTFWIGTSLAGSHFKVHSCSTADPDGDTALRDGVNALADSLWTPMTAALPAGMGPPKADDNGDPAIDIYLLATNLCRLREGFCFPIGGTAVAQAVDTSPYTNNAFGKKVSSGYIMLARNRVGTASLKSDFAHEFFHVLQFAHNLRGTKGDTGRRKNRKPVTETSWFVDASATWAEWKFVPETAADQVYPRFTEEFQKSAESLLDTTGAHDYASFIWSYFLQQEKGSANPIFQAWADIESAGNPDEVNDRVDKQLSFKEHFRDFAVRNLNMDLPGEPLVPLYEDQHEGQFPPDFLDRFRNRGSITLASVPPTPVRIKALAAQYDRFDSISFQVRKLTFDFAGIPGAALDVDAVVRIGGGWKRIRVQQFPLVFCRDNPEQNVEQIFLVLSHNDKKRSAHLSGSYKIKREAACTCGNIPLVPAWTGTLSYSYEKSAADSFTEIVLSHSAQVSFRLLPAPGLPVGFPVTSWVGLPTGNATIHDRSTSLPDGETATIDGAGTVVTSSQGFPVSQVFLYIDPFEVPCQYKFEFTPYVDAVATPSGGGLTGIGHVRSASRPLGDTATPVSGGAAFPAHSGFWIALNDGDGYSPGGFGFGMFLTGIVTENGGGSANVSWSFTPEPPP